MSLHTYVRLKNKEKTIEQGCGNAAIHYPQYVYIYIPSGTYINIMVGIVPSRGPRINIEQNKSEGVHRNRKIVKRDMMDSL